MRGVRGAPTPVAWLAPLAAAALSGCGGDQAMLGSASPGAAEVESLWWIALASTSVLSIVVIGALMHGVRRARRASAAGSGASRSDPADAAHRPGPAGPAPPDVGGTRARNREDRTILLLGAALPALFLVGFLAFSVRTGARVAQPPADPALTIEVVGHMFWWEVRYPDHGIVTANEIHIPVGRVVDVRVTSADVIHSFWVPQLSPGKIDMVPGRTNTVWMLATEPGRHRGQCTEFCGVQHALMSLSVTAHEEEGFDAWIEARTTPRPPPTTPDAQRGVQVFFEAGCAACHTIEGVRPPVPGGLPGPDLTDLAARETLGALSIPNDRAHLSSWIVDPHLFKPGVRMPPTRLSGQDLAALVSYLETLR